MGQLLQLSSTSVRSDESGIVHVRLSGNLRAFDLEVAAELVGAAAEAAVGFSIDCHDVTSYDPELREPARLVLQALKLRGAERGVCVTSSTEVRMKLTAVAFVLGMPVRFAPTREEAEVILARDVLRCRCPVASTSAGER